MLILIQFRAGFAPEAIQEVQDRIILGKGQCSVQEQGDGYALLDAYAPRSLYGKLHWKEWIFIRQWWIVEKIIPLSELLHTLEPQALRVEYPDTNEGRSLIQLAETIEQQALETDSDDQLAIFLPDRQRCFVGRTTERNAPWIMGIPRLRFPSGAPSRSTLKLEEAFEVFLSPREQEMYVRAGMHAVDLGAAPGGWTYQLIKRGMMVQAVDNGPLKGDVLGHRSVEHLKVDGFRFKPRKRVDWLVCDMVEQPRRVTELMLQWFTQGWTQQAIFNLKLQPGKRYAEVRLCQELLLHGLAEAGMRGHIRMRQLYHDREEITVYVRTGIL